MDKKKGLADNGDGEFILNESGTSISIDSDSEIADQESSQKEAGKNNDQKGSSGPEEKDITD